MPEGTSEKKLNLKETNISSSIYTTFYTYFIKTKWDPQHVFTIARSVLWGIFLWQNHQTKHIVEFEIMIGYLDNQLNTH